MSKVVLGKGLDALIPNDRLNIQKETKYRLVPLGSIAPNPMQPRHEFDEEKLASLAESFKSNGVIQPLLVRQNGNGYTIIAGERRYRAARLAGLSEMPVVLSDEIDDDRMLQLALVENLQREDLNPIETAEAYRTLADRTGKTQNELAEAVGKSRAAVANSMRLLTLPDAIKSMIRRGKLTEGHGRAMLALDTEADMIRMAQQIQEQSLSVREVEGRTSVRRKRRRLIPKRKLPALAEAESYLKQLLATSVKIHPGLKRGKIEIEYYSDDDLNRLLDLFRRITP